jgi:hypothetical protein
MNCDQFCLTLIDSQMQCDRTENVNEINAGDNDGMVRENIEKASER